MKRTLEALWNGAIAPGPNCGVGDHEIESLSILLDNRMEILSQTLNPKQRDLLKTYAKLADRYCHLLSSRAFCDGFSLAAKLLAETLTDPP